MSATDEFVSQCLAAMNEDDAASAAKAVVDRAVHDKLLIDELIVDAGVRVLHLGDTLTILHVVMAERPVGAGNPIPHNHALSAVIGVVHGGEANEFFRRAGDTLESAGGQVIAEGDSLMLGKDIIHSVKNPSSDRLSSALHVYGGNLVASEKTMWCEPGPAEEPFDLPRVLAS